MRSEGEMERLAFRFLSKCWQCGSTGLECRIHNPKVVGSSPTAAIFKVRFLAGLFFGLSVFQWPNFAVWAVLHGPAEKSRSRVGEKRKRRAGMEIGVRDERSFYSEY